MKLHFRSVRIGGLVAAIVVPALMLGALGFAQEGTKVELAGKSAKFKSIKVLKEVPEDQVIPIMHNWCSALGQGCTFCHVVNTGPDGKHTGFELDTKHEKTKAREMVLMCKDMMKHQKTLDNKVTCFMCHHGSKEPVMAPETAAK